MMPRALQKHFWLVIALVIFVSRLPALGFPILDIDEADFGVQTAVWMQGGVPYVDFVEKKTLVIHSWFGWIFKLFGTYNMTAVHLMDMLLILVTVAGVYLFTRYTAGEKTARWAALLYAFFQAFYDLNDFLSTTTESLMNVFAIFGAYVFFKSMREDKPGMSLLAGALVGISVLAKQVGAALIPVCVISTVWFWYEQKEHHWLRYCEEAFLFLIGMLFPVALLMGYLSDAGGLDGFIRWTWEENLTYASSGVSPWSFIGRALFQGSKFFAASWALWVLAGLAMVQFVRRHQWRVEVIFLTLWVIYCLPAISLGGRFFIHYFLQLLPPLTVLAAIGIVARVEPWLARVPKTALLRAQYRSAFAAIVFVVPFVVFFILHVVQVVALRQEMKPLRAIASYVQSVTKPDDRIFVWGHDADIYFFSRRLPAARFVYCSYLTGMKEGYELTNEAKAHQPDLNAWVMVQEDFARHAPAVIVDLAPTNWRGYGAFPISSQLFLANYVAEHYTLELMVSGAAIYVRRKPSMDPRL